MTQRIDSHQHYWRYNRARDGWITEDMLGLRRDFLPTHVAPEMFAARIDGVIAVQATQSMDETRFLLGLAAEHPFIRGVIGWIDVRASDLAEQLAPCREFTALKGFRHLAQAEPDDFLARPEVVRGVRLLGKHDYSFDLLIYPRQLTIAAQLVEACPKVRFVLDHCAKPNIAKKEFEPWRSELQQLSHYPNVFCKLSGLLTEAKRGSWRDEDIIPYLDAAAAAFGPDRLMFGSDWPVCLLASGYNAAARVIERWTSRLTPAQQQGVFGGTAIEVYRLERAFGS